MSEVPLYPNFCALEEWDRPSWWRQRVDWTTLCPSTAGVGEGEKEL